MTAQKDNSVTPPPLALSTEAAALKPKQPEEHGANPALTFPPEKGGPKGLEPTRYGDWEKKGPLLGFLSNVVTFDAAQRTVSPSPSTYF